VLDLWPESLSSAGGVGNRFILDSQTKLAQYVYNNCDKILIGSQGFRKSICEKGDYNGKLVYFPNWAETVAAPEDSSKYKAASPFADFADDDFIFLFAGNMGDAQNLDCIIDLAHEMRDNRSVKFVFLGDGRRKEHLIAKAARLGLGKSVFFLGRYPLGSMPAFMRLADVLLVSLKDDLIFSLTVPSKVQFYMAQGKPILAILNGDGAGLVNAAQCGIAVGVDDSSALRDAAEKFSHMQTQELQSLGANGKRYYERYFTKEQRMEQLEVIFQSAFNTSKVDAMIETNAHALRPVRNG
jgi:glycosyltransferase involved in cell wall biosynthesis